MRLQHGGQISFLKLYLCNIFVTQHVHCPRLVKVLELLYATKNINQVTLYSREKIISPKTVISLLVLSRDLGQCCHVPGSQDQALLSVQVLSNDKFSLKCSEGFLKGF